MASFNASELTIDPEPISSGGYAKVFLAEDTKSKKRYAIKIIDKQSLTVEKITSIKDEGMIASSLDHPHIVKTHLVVEDERYIKLYMDMYHDDLLIYLENNMPLTFRNIYRIFINILEGLRYMHDSYIIHRDIKLENILIKYQDNSDNFKEAALADFGLSAYRRPNDPLLNIYSGTIMYAAPEIVYRRQYRGYPADVWSLGVCLYILARSEYPKVDLWRTFRPILIESGDREFDHLISRMLDPDEDRRISVNEIFNHAWVLKWEDELDNENDPERYMYRS